MLYWCLLLLSSAISHNHAEHSYKLTVMSTPLYLHYLCTSHAHLSTASDANYWQLIPIWVESWERRTFEIIISLKVKVTNVASKPWAVPVAWFILVYHRECTTGFIPWGADQEADTAQGENKCCISLKTMPQSEINPVVNETCATLTGNISHLL